MIQDISESHQSSIANAYPHRKTKSKLIKKGMNSSLDISTTIQLNQANKQCRICLDNFQTSENQLVAPCKCSGSVKFVHDNCFRKWIERQYCQKTKKEQEWLLKYGIECELCKTKMRLIFQFRYSCCQTNKFSSKVKQNPFVFFLFVLFFLMNFGCTGYLAYNTAINPLSYSKQLIISMMTIIAFAFLAFTAILTTYYFVNDYIIQRVWALEGYEQKKRERGRHSRNQIIPEDGGLQTQ